VFPYVDKTPYRVITGAVEHTVFTPEQPAVSQLSLDMGTRVPLTKVPAQQAINGQTSYTSYVLQLPLRDAGGTLVLTSALLQKNADSASNYLPLTRANVIRQAFKFLGERYGWGDAYDGRDCSGFVSDVYRSMGVEMPRNTGQQATSPAFQHQLFSASDSHASRVAAVQSLQIGDLVYIPGHVMMVIGRIDGQPYVIHDVSQIRFHKTDGTIAQIKLNAVSVTPLLPLLFDDLSTYVDHMTSIVRMRR
jgi:cell wall-associated NlpC family hydrolase